MTWCFSTRASVATVLTMHPCVSRCLTVKVWILSSWTLCEMDTVGVIKDVLVIFEEILIPTGQASCWKWNWFVTSAVAIYGHHSVCYLKVHKWSAMVGVASFSHTLADCPTVGPLYLSRILLSYVDFSILLWKWACWLLQTCEMYKVFMFWGRLKHCYQGVYHDTKCQIFMVRNSELLLSLASIIIYYEVNWWSNSGIINEWEQNVPQTMLQKSF